MKQKDVGSSPVRAPKPQVAAEQPPTGRRRNTPEKEEKQPPRDGSRGTATVQSQPAPAGGRPTNWGQRHQRSPPTLTKVLSPTWGFPAWGSDKGTGNPQGTWPWWPAGLDYRTSTGLGKLTPVLGSTENTAHTTPQRRGAVIPPEAEADLLAGAGGSPAEARVSRAPHRDGALAAATLEGPPHCVSPLWGRH